MNSPLQNVFSQLNSLILGKETVLQHLMACILADGHVLLEDVPGVGKTTLAHGLAAVLGLGYRNVFQPADGQFKFHPGPIFHHFLLADEINRASPKMQSALLEAMEEKQVSVDGKTYRLPKPFFVIATQNPIEQLGTFPLPESQLDRFMMRLSLGYPSTEAERRLYAQGDRRQLLPALKAVCNAEILLQWQAQAAQVKCSQQAADYVYRLVQSTRQPGLFVTGLSPRAGLAVVKAAKAWAFLAGRDYVLPEDIKAVWIAVAGHRLQTLQPQSIPQLLEQMLLQVAVS